MIYSFLEPPLILRLFISRSLLSQRRAIGSKPSIPHHLPLLPKIPRSPLLVAGLHSDAMSRTPPAPQKRRRRGGQKLEEGLFFASLNAPYDVIIDMPPSSKTWIHLISSLYPFLGLILSVFILLLRFVVAATARHPKQFALTGATDLGNIFVEELRTLFPYNPGSLNLFDNQGSSRSRCPSSCCKRAMVSS